MRTSLVTLIRPPAVETVRLATTSITPPLGLAYIAASVLQSGREVRVLDAVALAPAKHRPYFKGYLIGMDNEDLVAEIPANSTAIGVTAIFTHEWPLIVRLIECIRNRFPCTPIIVGGEHITSMPGFCARTCAADYFVCGEGEETIVELLETLELSRLERAAKLETIAGLAYKEGNELRVNPRRKRNTKLDDIAWPAWDRFDLKTYHDHGFIGGMYSEKLTVPILATRGCPYQCTYCSSPNMWSPLWLPRDPIQVVDEIESYVKNWGAGNFPFQDLTAIINKEWIITFASEIVRRNLSISWQLPSGTRSEVIDDEVAEWLKRSGMKTMAYAPEAGSERTRKLIHKRVRPDRMLASVESANRSGLSLTAFFVIGFPHDSHRDMVDGLNFIAELAKRGMNDIAVGYYMALPGTQLFHKLYDLGEIRFDREYFSHILDSQSFVPRRSFTPKISRFGLVFWKFSLFSWFYAHRIFYSCKRQPARNILFLVFSVLHVWGRGSHHSRLQTVAKNFVAHVLNVWKLRKHPKWNHHARNHSHFDNWDEQYRIALLTQRATGAAYDEQGKSFNDLHQNYYAGLRKGHRLSWQMRLS